MDPSQAVVWFFLFIVGIFVLGTVLSGFFQVRTADAPASAVGAIREAVRRIDPNLPLMDVATQDEQIDKNLQQERVFAQAYAMFGGLAMLIASVGLFGLMSYSVARRTNEIGIRMALGAQRGDVLRLVMSESMRLVAIGVVAGSAEELAALQALIDQERRRQGISAPTDG
jgi:predicted lysophospholipase L1 biosynthesis ABC-type transport system permease subunit